MILKFYKGGQVRRALTLTGSSITPVVLNNNILLKTENGTQVLSTTKQRTVPIAVVIPVAIITVALIAAFVTLLVLRIVRYEPGPPAPPERKPADLESGTEAPPVQEWFSRYAWLIPHVVITIYLLCSAFYTFMTVPSDRLPIVLILLTVLTVYGLTVYQVYSDPDNTAFFPTLLNNLKWTGILIAAYVVNRLCRGSFKNWPDEFEMFFSLLRCVVYLFFPFGPKVVEMVRERGPEVMASLREKGLLVWSSLPCFKSEPVVTNLEQIEDIVKGGEAVVM
jgi:hypothetical protein